MTPGSLIKAVLLLLVTSVRLTQGLPGECDALPLNGATLAVPAGGPYVVGGTLNVTCRPGHAFSQQTHLRQPSVLLTCLSRGWDAAQIPNCAYEVAVQSISDPLCAPLTASTIPADDGNRTLVSGNGTSYGSIFRYYCSPGFRLEGSPIVHCLHSWHNLGPGDVQPTCQRVTCTLPPPSPRLTYTPHPGNAHTILSLTSVNVTCHEGYALQGAASVTCLTNGVLNATFSCEDVDECIGAPCAHHCHNVEGSFRCYCRTGFTVVADNSTQCEAVDECEGRSDLCPGGQCLNLDSAEGGYKCECSGRPGYVLFGEDGTEGHHVPPEEASLDSVNVTLRVNHTCVLRECPLPDTEVPNGFLLGHRTRYHVQDRLGFECRLGYVLVGNPTLMCQPNGTWSSAAPQCEAVSCNLTQAQLQLAEYGNVTTHQALSAGASVMFGQLVEVSCSGQSNVSQRACVYNWEANEYTLGTDAPFTCQNVACMPQSANVDVGNGSLVLLSGTKDMFGSVYEVVCAVGAFMSGTTGREPRNETRCGVDGTWALGTAYCQLNPMCNYTRLENMTTSAEGAAESMTTLADCEASCAGSAACAAFEWRADSAACFTFTAFSDSQLLTNYSSDLYQKTCVLSTTTTTNATVERDACSSLPCQNNATCNTSDTGYTCQCAAGYSGSDCFNNTSCDLITSTACPRCVPSIRDGGRLCTCTGLLRPDPAIDRSGRWWESYPGVSPVCVTYNPCDAGLCLNGGMCALSSAGTQTAENMPAQTYSCQCPVGYVGRHCQVSTDECASDPCRHGGTCTDLHNAYTCNCLNGTTDFYSAAQCMLGCDADPCSMAGTDARGCTSRLTDYHCPCKAGYTGQNCQTEVDLCVGGPCEAGTMSCVSQPAGVSCTCKPGWTGSLCEQLVSHCAQQPCVKGTCHDLLNSYYCACDIEEGGECDSYVTQCDNITQCYGNSSCIANTAGAGFTCQCAPGLVGADCFYMEDHCGSVCSHMSVCQVQTPGLANLVCKTRGELPKQLVMNMTLGSQWDDATSFNEPCGSSCIIINQTLHQELGNIRFLGNVPSEDGIRYIVFDYIAFASQVTDIQRAGRPLDIHTKTVPIHEVGFYLVRPLYGPRAGGTVITVTGYNFAGAARITLGAHPCSIQKRSSVLLVCLTQSAELSQVVQGSPITVLDDVQSVSTRHNFTYMSDPNISSISRLATILSGGTDMFVNGTNLRSVSRPRLSTTLTHQTDTSAAPDKYITDCAVRSDTFMTCVTPDVTGSVLLTPGRRRLHRRALSDVIFTLGFLLDGVLTFQQLGPTFGSVSVFPDPQVNKFPADKHVFRTTWPFREKLITIMGHSIPDDIEVRVQVGAETCIVKLRSRTSITCQPPSAPPARPPANNTLVLVKIGRLVWAVGELQYVETVWQYLPARYGLLACLALLLVLSTVMVVLCVCRRRHSKPDEEKFIETRYDQYIPRATRDHLMRPGSRSNHVEFEQDYDCHSISTYSRYSSFHYR